MSDNHEDAASFARRSRFSEMKFGEITDFMLHRAPIPVIMLHG
jgi:nucleotide-binding universal stress UspA family protein